MGCVAEAERDRSDFGTSKPPDRTVSLGSCNLSRDREVSAKAFRFRLLVTGIQRCAARVLYVPSLLPEGKPFECHQEHASRFDGQLLV